MKSRPERLPDDAARVLQESATEREVDVRLRQMQKLETIGRFTTRIAHDFNNQLTVIKGSAHSLLSILPPADPCRSDIERINATVDAGARLIRQLLTFSQPQLLHITSLSLTAIVNEMATMLRLLLGEQITLQTRAAVELWPVRADRDQVEQVVMNLVANARDAIALAGEATVGDTVTVETANVELSEHAPHVVGGSVEPGPYVMLAISDNGIGIAADVMERIFEPFFTTKEIGKGTGLGLATVLGIMKRQRGYIACDSAPGRGTTFRAYFRRESETIPAPGATAAAPAPEPGTPATILVVEDDDDVRELLVRVLAEAGYRVYGAATAATAVTIVARLGTALDVLVTDVVMPGMGGPTLARRLVTHYPALRVLFTSGYITDRLDVSGVPGAQILAKPLDMHDVLRIVSTLLSGGDSFG